MGDYTELVLGVRLKKSQKKITDVLKYMLSTDECCKEIVPPNHKLFKESDRWKWMLLCGSYYFDGQPDSKLTWDIVTKTYFLNVRCNLKNYNNEIENFLDWICPHIETRGFIGYYRFEYNEDPTLIYNKAGKIEYKHLNDVNNQRVNGAFLEELGVFEF